MTSTSKMKSILATFVIIIIGLALTPAVATAVNESKYQTVTKEPFDFDPAVANYTILANSIRNDTVGRAAIRVYMTIDAEPEVFTLEADADLIKIINAAQPKNMTFATFVKTCTYENCSVTYQTIDLTNVASLAIIGTVPLIWVIVILAIGIVAVKHQLGKTE